MNYPLVSIIIPVYNGEKYITNITKNIEQINYPNFEVIFINDGSTDNTYELLKSLKMDNYILVNQENAGVSAARNAGLSRSNGEYICFIDVDDFVNSEILNVFVQTMKKNECDVVFCDSSSNLVDVNLDNIPQEIYGKDIALKKFVLRDIQIGVWGLFVKKKLLLDHNLTFQEGYAYSEDLHMVFRIFNSTEKIVHIKLPLYNYKENDGSVMTKVDEKRFDSIILMQDLEKYFKKNNPDFYPFFKKYGVSRTSWAILWQAVRYLDYSNFKLFIKKYDFKSDMKKLLTFPKFKVKISALLFLFSNKIYYDLTKIMTKNYRS